MPGIKLVFRTMNEDDSTAGRGKSMREAADTLGVTPRTIAFHKYRMMENQF